MRLVIAIPVKRVIQLLALVALVLAALSVSGQLYRNYIRIVNPNLFGFVPLLDVGQDHSIPALYSALLLLFCSALLAMVSFAVKNAGGPYVNHWRVLSIIFLYLSVDEGASIHEKLGDVTRFVFRSIGSELGARMPDAWVIPQGALVLIFVLAYLKFFFHLPEKQRFLILAAGAIYVGSTMGLEVFDSYYASLFPASEMTILQKIGRILLITAEEILEMFGIIVFIYALLSYIGSYVEEIRLQPS
jgi:hypothetical protein